jgi:Fe-S-cluster containining protein
MNKEKIYLICKKCKAKCCRMGGPDFTKKGMQKVLDAGFKDYFYKEREKFYGLKCKKGICPYLKKDYSCEIHNVLPNMCKCWPVYLEYKNGKKKFVLYNCPLTKYLNKEDIERMKKQVSKIPKEIISEPFSEGDMKLQPELKYALKIFKTFKKKEIK